MVVLGGGGSRGGMGSQPSVAAGSSGPVCSFCGVSGHFMATCDQFEQYMVKMVKRVSNTQ